MNPPPVLEEEARLRSLHATGILDTPRDERFDRLVYIASQVVKAPSALIGFLDRERLWLKARVGVSETEFSRSDVWCEMAMGDARILTIPDARAVPQFWGHTKVVGKPFIRFYACVPIRSDDGQPIGTLSVFDSQPRTLSEVQKKALVNIGRQAEDLVRERIIHKEPFVMTDL